MMQTPDGNGRLERVTRGALTLGVLLAGCRHAAAIGFSGRRAIGWGGKLA